MSTCLTENGTYEEDNMGFRTGLVAKAGGGAGGTLMSTKWNEINTCITDQDSVMLPSPLIGLEVNIYNDTPHIVRVWTNAGTIAQQIPAGVAIKYFCLKTGQKWGYIQVAEQNQ